MNNVLVTGANRGIGLELCRQLDQRGDAVIAVCRQSGEALRGLGVQIIDGIDVTVAESVADLVRAVGENHLDWLLNNAGMLARDSLDQIDFEQVEQQFRVNAIGPLRVTRALLPRLGRGSKIGIVTSRMGSIGDNTSGGYYGYRMSKAAVNIAGVSLDRDLEARGIAIALLHPGMVATDMTGGHGTPVSEAADGLIRRMDQLNSGNSGTFWHAQGEVLPW